MPREGKIWWKKNKEISIIIKSQLDHKSFLKDIWNELKSSEDWKRFEEFAFCLISHLSDEEKIYFHSNLRRDGSETDSILCFNDTKWGKDVLIEAKFRKDSEPTFVNQIYSAMKDHNIYLGFLVTKSRLTGTGGQLTKIRSKNKSGEVLITPIQGPHIEEFFLTKESTNDFLVRMINIAKYKAESLYIPIKAS